MHFLTFCHWRVTPAEDFMIHILPQINPIELGAYSGDGMKFS